MLRDQMFSDTFVETNFQTHRCFVPFFSQVWELLRVEWWFACFSSLLAKTCHLPAPLNTPPLFFFWLWVIILWTRRWEKSDFPSLHCNLDLGIIHHPPSPNSRHRKVSSSNVSCNRGTYSRSGNKNIIYVSVKWHLSWHTSWRSAGSMVTELQASQARSAAQQPPCNLWSHHILKMFEVLYCIDVATGWNLES